MSGQPSQRRRKPYSRESIAHALAHHESRGALLTVSPPEPGGRSTWRVVVPKFGALEPFELTEPQAYALCIGLAAGEDHARVEHERFVHELNAYNGDESPVCVDEPRVEACGHRWRESPQPGERCASVGHLEQFVWRTCTLPKGHTDPIDHHDLSASNLLDRGRAATHVRSEDDHDEGWRH